jgi:hypothetical protein
MASCRTLRRLFPGPVAPLDQQLDTLALAATQLLAADVQPTAFVINPRDMANIELLIDFRII